MFKINILVTLIIVCILYLLEMNVFPIITIGIGLFIGLLPKFKRRWLKNFIILFYVILFIVFASIIESNGCSYLSFSDTTLQLTATALGSIFLGLFLTTRKFYHLIPPLLITAYIYSVINNNIWTSNIAENLKFKIKLYTTAAHDVAVDTTLAEYFHDSSSEWRTYISTYNKELDLKPIDSLHDKFRIFIQNSFSRNIVCEVSLKDDDSMLILTYRKRTKRCSDTSSKDIRVRIGNKDRIITQGKIIGPICHDTIYDLSLVKEIKEKLTRYQIHNMLSVQNRGILGGYTIIVDVHSDTVNRFRFNNAIYNDARYNDLQAISEKLLKYYKNESDEIEVFE